MRIGRPLDPPIVAPPSSALFSHSLKSLGFTKNHFGGTSSAAGLGSVGGGSAYGLGSAKSMGLGSVGGTFGPGPAAGGTGFGSSLVGTMGKGQGPRSLTMRGRDWQQSDWLRTRTEQYARYDRGAVLTTCLACKSEFSKPASQNPISKPSKPSLLLFLSAPTLSLTFYLQSISSRIPVPL